MDTATKVRLVITDFQCEPDEISRTLGIEPSLFWRAGDFIDRTSRRYAENGWRLDAPGAPLASFAQQISELIALLASVKPQLRDLANSGYLELSCVLYVRDSAPEMHFERTTVQWLADIGANIDIDIYPMTEEFDEQEASELVS